MHREEQTIVFIEMCEIGRIKSLSKIFSDLLFGCEGLLYDLATCGFYPLAAMKI